METQTQTANDGTIGRSGGFRNTLRRWREKWKRDGKKAPIATPNTRPTTNSSATSPPPPPQPGALFTPTTQTVISSPLDPRNRSPSASPAGTLKKQHLLSRRNTAPANYYATTEQMAAITPINTITTTISAAPSSPKSRRASRVRLSLAKRGSIQLSPSTPNLYDQANRRATCQVVTPVKVERRRADSETLVEEEDVVRRDLPKGDARESIEEMRVAEVTT
ncbi:hypothetical protein BU26DRAFT_517162 [Trematosphaeria pertusa]|uniref:Uncharacterized protein n=1 Tax=Trematosphaeria pertusa TaxID=390896 RepID=A0A6A6IPU1_9PLEO|nr:uncharacterized protein BU26DRAFT_517162 [Trematosphaeria pertusa]KAF2252564.1 hypothetical protein BU26DRAFT_517162 [Trematosphaeria pertusa]